MRPRLTYTCVRLNGLNHFIKSCSVVWHRADWMIEQRVCPIGEDESSADAPALSMMSCSSTVVILSLVESNTDLVLMFSELVSTPSRHRGRFAMAWI